MTGKQTGLLEAKWFRSAVLESCDGSEALARLDGIADLAVEFDGGRLLPDDSPEQKSTATARNQSLPLELSEGNANPSPNHPAAATPSDDGQLGLDLLRGNHE